MKIVRKIIHIDEEKCNGCGQCILSCAEGAIVLRDGKAKVIGDMYCDGLGACMGSCPTDALTIIEREADPFDEKAVEELLARQGQPPLKGCPGTRQESFQPAPFQPDAFRMAGEPSPDTAFQNSEALLPLTPGQALSITPHWPVKLRLTNPEASYLHGVHLYLAADCSAFAAMNFHSLMTATPTALLTFCPKFEPKEIIMEKLDAIFAMNAIQSFTTIRMEVPCCTGILHYSAEALKASKNSIPHTHIILSRKGERLTGL